MISASFTFRECRVGGFVHRVPLGPRIAAEKVKNNGKDTVENSGQPECDRNDDDEYDDRLRNERQTGDPQLDPVPPPCYRVHTPYPNGAGLRIVRASRTVRHADVCQQWTVSCEASMIAA